MDSAHLEENPQGIEGKLKLIATAVPVFAAVTYPLGFVLLNVAYTMWGFTDFQVLHAQCFLVVAWISLMILAASLPVFLVLSFKGISWSKLSIKKRAIVVGLLIVAIGVGAGLWVWGKYDPSSIRSLIIEQLRAVSFILIALPGCVALIVPVGLVKDHKRVSDVSIQEWGAGVLGVVAATLFFSMTYLFIPASWGGGMPVLKTYLVPPHAVAFLAPYNWDAKQAADLAKLPTGTAPEFIKVEGLYLIHEGSDRVVLLSEPCQKLLRLPKQWFQEDAWDAPESKTAASASRNVKKSNNDCPSSDISSNPKIGGTNSDGKSVQGAVQNTSQATLPPAPRK